MGKIILVTGGARSGKSSFAENMVSGFGGNILYIATSIPFDEEMKERVKKHKESRPKEWDTYEGFEKLNEVIKARGNSYNGVLIDCITILISNLMFYSIGDNEENLNSKNINDLEEKIRNEINDILDEISRVNGKFVIVTNEVGYGIVPENKLARIYRDIVGRINQNIASKADEVYLVTCGLPMKIK